MEVDYSGVGQSGVWVHGGYSLLVQCMCEHASSSKLPPPCMKLAAYVHCMCIASCHATHLHHCSIQLVAHDQLLTLEGLVGVKEMKQFTV